jgi:FMN phosphatase YigB (HAD superfamily)
MPQDPLSLWSEGVSKRAITGFVERVTKEHSPDFLPPEERIAVFDNDGTLWCEKPMPIQMDFILRYLVEMAENDPKYRDRQPWKAAYEKDYKWLGETISKHYQGDDGDLRVLVAGVQQSFGGMTVEAYESRARTFLEMAYHPTLHCQYLACVFAPMRELLGYLKTNGFTNYIASSGDRDFMRVVTNRLYGISRDHVIGSAFGLKYQGNGVLYKPNLEFFDDGAEKPVRIWSRVGRRPIMGAGNSNGDIEMLDFAGGSPRLALRLLVLHDDAAREFSYEVGAERALERAKAQAWTIVSVQKDWVKVFAEATAGKQVTTPGKPPA